MNQLDLFPAFSRFVRDSGLGDRAKGNLAAKIPRILGQGTTKAVGLELPPAPIERRMELVSLPSDIEFPDDVVAEIEEARKELEKMQTDLAREDGRRHLAFDSLARIEQPNGTKDGKFFANGMLLLPGRNGLEWAWSVTPYYAIIKRIPPDPDYIVKAFKVAHDKLRTLAMPPDVFGSRLELAWMMARHFIKSDDVPVLEVMKMFNVAGQDERFWQNPQRQFFKDLPEAAFVINLMEWRSTTQTNALAYEFVPATLHQAHGPAKRAFYLPMNVEGTDVRPMMFLRKR